MYFFVSAPPFTVRTSIPALWAISVNRTKVLVAPLAAEKLQIAKTQAAKSNPIELKPRLRDTAA
jgi:hypothetical protein